jgi:hypothetical protein
MGSSDLWNFSKQETAHASGFLSTPASLQEQQLGGASRDTDRTPTVERERQLGLLHAAQCEVLVDEQLERLMAIFEQHLGIPSHNPQFNNCSSD